MVHYNNTSERKVVFCLNFKRIIALIMMVSIVLTMSVSAVAVTTDTNNISDQTVIQGDYDNSGKITASDAVYLLYYVIFGGEDYPLNSYADLNGDGKIDSDDAVYLLYNALYGEGEYPFAEYDENRVAIRFNSNGDVSSYELVPGDELPVNNSAIDKSFNRHAFLGWYDSTRTTQYTKVPDKAMTLYALYEGYNAYTFDGSSIYDPNNKQLVETVNDPFGGKGKVFHAQVINKNDTVNYGYYKGLAPTAYEGASNKGFDFKKNHKYEVSFKYRFADGTPAGTGGKVSVYASNGSGIHASNFKSTVKTEFADDDSLKVGSDWSEFKFTATNTTDYKYLYIRILGGSSSKVYDLYIDDLVIIDVTPDDSIKLSVHGVTDSTDLKVGDTLPVLDPIYDKSVETTFNFDGWYDETLTTKYTVVDESVKTYYAKYEYYSELNFETNGIYDPNGKYSDTPKYGVNDWWREVDPTGEDNITLRADLSKNANNTHVALSQIEGTTQGYKLTAGKQYVMYWYYYVDSSDERSPSFSVRGSAQANIGGSGGKTNSISSFDLNTKNQWLKSAIKFTAPESAETSPYFILMAQLEKPHAEYCKVYIDNVILMEFGADEEIIIKTPANGVSFNDNGNVTVVNETYVGALLPDSQYYGANFLGWYDEAGIVPYTTVNKNGASYFAKHNGAVLNFENGGMYDPNGNYVSESSKVKITNDPTNADNNVVKVNLKNSSSNYNFGLNESGYSNEGYKLTVGNKYEISFMYYIENVNSKGVAVQFRGCNPENIGVSGGKTSDLISKYLKNGGEWTGVTVEFVYTGSTSVVESPYLVMMAQDGSHGSGASACTATIYFDDIVIKEIAPSKTYIKKDIKIGNWTLGYQDREHNIVIPSNNFSYLARMQCDELANVIKNITTTECNVNVVYESDWTEKENQINIFVGNVAGHSRDNQNKIDASSFTDDDFAYTFAKGNVYVNAKSTYAMAMGVSELARALEAAEDGTQLSGKVQGKYSEKIDSYSTETYYRPTMLEDFDGEEIDTTRWTVHNRVESGSVTEGKDRMRSAKHTYLENGNLVIEAAFDDQYYYGGMLKSHGLMDYLYGYLEISCITPHGAGIWTAMWATPNGTNTGLFRSEIDINESFGNARYTAFNMHSWLTTAGKNYGYTKYSLDQRNCPKKKADAGAGKTFNDDFHTFGYFWTQDRGVFTVDGRVQFELVYKDNEKYYHDDMDAFNERLCLIVSMTVGNPGHSAQFNLDESADYWYTSNKFIVDYVHIYQVDGQLLNYYPPKE